MAIEAGAALSAEAKPQAGMGVSIGDYNRDGKLDIVKTNFAGDTDSLYTNLGDGNFEDRTYPSGLGVNTRLLGWGVGFFDMDNDGWLDILMSNGHVYPEVDNIQDRSANTPSTNTSTATCATAGLKKSPNQGGPGIIENAPARGCAFGDYDNDGDIDIAVNCINAIAAAAALRLHAQPQLDQDQASRHQVQPHRHRQPRHCHRKNIPDRGKAAGADGRAAQRRQLLLAKRPAHALRPRPSHKGRHRSKFAG